ncbi:hypothetical protein ACHAWU_001645 [Discostella pseudostelligera]|uniref:CCHC-type domain-containing protein n=1 Tax=Discostella pseudostelligera TaxID=259834 RepID=A0ABD3MF05_9STRA
MEEKSRSPMKSSTSKVPPPPPSDGKNMNGPSPHRKRRKGKGEPKPKMTKEERRAKYTAIAHNRRDANIARARDKHIMCYRCRKTGHSAENCKNIADAKSDDGEDTGGRGEGKEKMSYNKKQGGNICYKCGSTEHRIQACPKIKPFLPPGGKNKKIDFGKIGDLPFANCYVCNKSGHLASHCPESAKGLYPQGGSCRECGSVYHFVADCPEKDNAKRTRHESDDRGDDDDSLVIDQFLEDEDPVVEEKVEKKAKKRKVVRF